MTPKTIFFIIIVILFSGFVVQNAEVVEIKFLFWSFEASRAIVLIMTYLTGIISGWLSVLILKRKKKSTKRPESASRPQLTNKEV